MESNSNGATRPVAKDAEGDGDQRNAINPSEKRNRSPLRTRATLGPLTKLEDHVPADWWERQFDALYLKTDGDVVEDADITRREIDIFLRLLPLNPEARILDLCCGQGRHVANHVFPWTKPPTFETFRPATTLCQAAAAAVSIAQSLVGDATLFAARGFTF